MRSVTERPDPLGLDEVYDPETLEALDAWCESPARRAPAPSSGWRTRCAAGAVVTGLALGMREVFEPDPHQEAVIEIDRDPDLDVCGPVTVSFVRGDPRGSVVVLRPWLA